MYRKLIDGNDKVDFVEQTRLVNAFRLIQGIKTMELTGADELKDEQVSTVRLLYLVFYSSLNH